ncbi:MAG TPA: aminotransferase class IV [Gemmatales bacterium]|nr:aminotransferase class IV [Gemmatales bacterium]
MAEPLAYRNGSLLPAASVAIPLNDAGFTWGATVTDAVRTMGRTLFRWPDHLARFRTSCALAAVPLLADDETLTAAAADLIQHNGPLLAPHEEMMLVLLATPGPLGPWNGRPHTASTPTLILYTQPLDPRRFESLWSKGVALELAPNPAPDPSALPPQAKHRSRLHWWRAEQAARERDPEATALLTSAAGCLLETWNSNVLLVAGGAIITPPRAQVLSGITLLEVERLCQKQGIPFSERPWPIADLAGVEEMMLTCTSFCLAPVRRVGHKSLPCPGPVCQRLRAAWEAEHGPFAPPVLFG